MSRWEYRRGLQEVGDGLYAYLQPDGGWGWSNAGLIAGSEGSLLVDTLFDLHLTREMLEAMRAVAPDISVLVNTHANGDHCWGNELVSGARIVATARTAAEMVEGSQPASLQALKATDGAIGEFARRAFGAFDFDGISVTPPSETFSGELRLEVGGHEVALLEVGPAHTQGDTLVYVPDQRILFAGDIVFNGGHPVIWAGPVSNWIAALDRILALDLQVLVPGHGPIADKRAAEAMRKHLAYLHGEARARFQAGMAAEEAARDIDLSPFAGWGERERVAANVLELYAEFEGGAGVPAPAALAAMAAYSAG